MTPIPKPTNVQAIYVLAILGGIVTATLAKNGFVLLAVILAQALGTIQGYMARGTQR